MTLVSFLTQFLSSPFSVEKMKDEISNNRLIKNKVKNTNENMIFIYTIFSRSNSTDT